MLGVELYRDVRLAVVEEGLSEREAARPGSGSIAVR